jgi:hypothetical protein
VVDVPPFCCLDEPHTIRRELEAADIVLVAVDDEAPKYLIDAMAWELQRPVVYGGVYGGGWGAEVVLVDPIAATPCYGCAASVLGRTGVKLGKNNLIPSYALPNAGQDEDGWTLADLTSIKPAATLLSNVAIAWLEADAGHPARLDELQQDASTAWRFAFRHVPVWNLGPWCLQPVAVNPKPDCPQVCGLPGVIPIKHVCGDANLLVIAADGCELQRKAAG